MQQKKWMDEKNKIPTNKMTNPLKNLTICLYIQVVNIITHNKELMSC